MCGVIEWSIIYMKIFLIYLLLMNIAGFAAMGIDKCKAKAHAWRIPEKTLFGLSLLGGSAGTWAGMYAFRHKTKHWYFVKGMPLIFFIPVSYTHLRAHETNLIILGNKILNVGKK